jgi:hypothetical protein
MVMLYKSCSAFHRESKKNAFAFFLIFLQFSTDFTRISKTANTILDPLYKQVPEKIWFYAKMPLVHRLPPRKMYRLAMRSLGHGQRRFRPKSGEPAARVKRWGSSRCSPRA